MAGNPLVGGSPSFPLVEVVRNPAQAADQDGSVSIVGGSRNGSIYADPIHGNTFHGNIRGRMFSAAANGVTGRTILAAAGTTSGFMFYNPSGSGVEMEIVEIICLPLTATDVVGVIGLEVGAPPTTVTNAVTPVSNLQGDSGQTALCKASYGSTIVAMTFLSWLPIFVQTTAGVLQGSTGIYRPEGRLILGPNGAANIISSTSQSTNLWAQSVTWIEWPK
jgi:hypothetical protein